ncbi:hypothetical protein Q5P01_021685 [Channa striata]|uniref:Uncharacterized protein n=1 Tax=Channa striata TaxID=64152 RepID=A0AA88RYP5_CHASR|nr:hypothetical protein Q5P01_021685 [Channa striata]
MYGGEREREGDRMRERKKKRLARKGSTPLSGKHRRDSCGCCSILDSSQQYAGRDFGANNGVRSTDRHH